MIDVIITSIPNRNKFEGIFEPNEKGSCSTYRNVLTGCAHAANLSVEYDQMSSGARLTGSYFHTMTEHYHQGRRAVYELADEPDELVEARRLFSAYTKVVNAEAFGQVVGAEMPFPSTKEQRSLMKMLVGQDKFKCIMDLVTVMTQEDVNAWGLRGLALPGPGTYITDHKTTSKWSETSYEKSLVGGYQFITYPEVVQHWINAGLLTLPPVQGMIGNIVVGRKEPLIKQFFSTRQPWLMEMVRRDFARAQEKLDADEKNGAACFGQWGTECYYLQIGKCGRV